MAGYRQGEWAWTVAVPDRAKIRRPRLIARVDELSQARVAMIWAPAGIGRTTLVRAWAETTDRSVHWLVPGRADWCEVLDTVRAGPRPATVVLREPEYTRDRHCLRELVRLLDQAPDVHVLILGGSQWNGPVDPELESLRAGAVMRAGEFRFGPDELTELADQRGQHLTVEVAASIHELTGGVPPLVLAALQASATGADVLDRVLDVMSSAARAAGLVRASRVDPWEVMLLCSLPDTFTMALVEDVWPGGGPPAVRTMIDIGVVAAVNPEAFAPRLALPGRLRTGLRRRAMVELDDQRFDRVLGRMVDHFATSGELDVAIDLVDTYGLHQRLAEWLSARWLELGGLPAERVRATMDRAARSPQQDGRLLIGHARAVADVTHEGHPGRISPAERLYASALLEAATAKPDAASAATLAAIASTRGALARVEGDHRTALAAHAEALAALTPLQSATPFDVSAYTQAGLTKLSVGDLRGALRDFSVARDLTGELEQTFAARYARALHTFTATLLERPLPDDPAGEPPADPTPGPDRAVALTRALANLRALDLPQVWAELSPPSWAADGDDPLILDLFRAEVEGYAHVLAGTGLAGLEALDLMESGLESRVLSGYERSIVHSLRADLLIAAGDPDQALLLLGSEPPSLRDELRVTLARTRAFLALGRPQDGLEQFDPGFDSTPSGLRRYRTPALVAAALALAELGEEERAAQHLERALAISARSGNMLPFAMHGREAFGTLVQLAQTLALEPTSAHLLELMARQRDRLRSASLRVRLTGREKVLLRHLVSTRATRRLAAQLHVSPNTVKSQLQSIYRKFGVSTREEALKVAELMGLLPAPTTT